MAPKVASRSGSPIVNAPSTVQRLLERAHSQTTAARIFTEKIQSKPLLLQPTVNTDKRALRRHIRERKNQYHIRKQAKKGTKPLSAKEKRRLGIYRLTKEDVRGEGKWEVYKGLNELWTGYMLEVLGYTKQGTMVESWEQKEANMTTQGSLLASADMHGSWMEVVRSRDVGRVGVEGIVVRETKYQFTIIGEGRKSWCVPKRGSAFAVTIRLPNGRNVVFEVQGSLFEYRPVERANRKFKLRVTDGV